ncbi:C-type mannose receptor 2 [Oryzias melastigma]|uniref:C-type mannose receptor 2 n=1 Tax=Oryzias melastigma TaxID=30732 RepID=UPI00168D780D|nr:C-type mannose receptor 2 [Oryzias melastigma]
MYDGLASISGPEDMKEISSSLPLTTRVWIGLYDALDSWKWSDPRTGGNLGDYRPWQTGLPDNVGGVECCGAISKDGYWRDYTCTGLLLPFLCFNAQQDGYVLELQPRSWLDAQSFCRLHHADLATVTSLTQGDEAKALLQGASVEQAWFGLHRDSWVWTDGSDMSYTSWLAGQPNNAGGSQSCVYMEAEKWNDFPCSYQYYVLCQKLLPKRKKFVLKLHISSDVNLPAVRGSLLQQLLSRLADSGLTDVRVSWR